MKPYKKTLIAKTTMYRKEYNVATKHLEPYWDEGITFYPKYKKGFKNTNKKIMSYQVRMYKTWKHNRKTRWK
jgi:hypothetical protein